MAQLHFSEGEEGTRKATVTSLQEAPEPWLPAVTALCQSQSKPCFIVCFFIYLRGFLLRYFTQTLCLFLYLILWKIPKKPRLTGIKQGAFIANLILPSTVWSVLWKNFEENRGQKKRVVFKAKQPSTADEWYMKAMSLRNSEGNPA